MGNEELYDERKALIKDLNDYCTEIRTRLLSPGVFETLFPPTQEQENARVKNPNDGRLRKRTPIPMGV